MILYTTMPQELVFEEKPAAQQKEKIVQVNGVSLLVEQVTPSQCRIVQLLSTDPNQFLNSAFNPGQVIEMKPSID